MRRTSPPLTPRTIAAIRPGTKPLQIRDGAERGLYYVVHPAGSRTFVLKFAFRGKNQKLNLGDIGLADARRKAREARVLIDAGRNPAQEKTTTRIAVVKATQEEKKALIIEKARVSDEVLKIVERYAAVRLVQIRTGVEARKSICRAIDPLWKGRPINAITKRDVNEVIDAMLEKGHATSANRTYSHLRTFFEWCVEKGYIEASPMSGIRKPAKEKTRDRVLEDSELALIWKGCDRMGYPFGDAIKLLTLTGQRRGEICGASWSEIDPAARLLRLPSNRTKNGVAHDAPLPPMAFEIIEGAKGKASGSEFVFTNKKGKAIDGIRSDIKDRLDSIISEINGGQPIAHWTIHDLRRTCASGLARLGTDVVTIEKLLNHQSGVIKGVAATYNRYSYAPEMKDAADRWARHVERVINGEDGRVVELKRLRR